MPLPPPRKPLPPPRERQPEPEEIPLENLTGAERRERLRKNALAGFNKRSFDMPGPPPKPGQGLPEQAPRRAGFLKTTLQMLLVTVVIVGIILSFLVTPPDDVDPQAYKEKQLYMQAQVPPPPKEALNVTYLDPIDAPTSVPTIRFEGPAEAMQKWINSAPVLADIRPKFEGADRIYRIRPTEKSPDSARMTDVAVITLPDPKMKRIEIRVDITRGKSSTSATQMLRERRQARESGTEEPEKKRERPPLTPLPY